MTQIIFARIFARTRENYLAFPCIECLQMMPKNYNVDEQSIFKTSCWFFNIKWTSLLYVWLILAHAHFVYGVTVPLSYKGIYLLYPWVIEDTEQIFVLRHTGVLSLRYYRPIGLFLFWRPIYCHVTCLSSFNIRPCLVILNMLSSRYSWPLGLFLKGPSSYISISITS